jgi:phosphoribosylaminoimidazole carboxylase
VWPDQADPVHRLGFKIAVLDPGGAECAAAVMSDRVVHGGLKDAEKCRELAEGCDVVTLEIEHVNCDVLAELEGQGVNVQPSAQSVRIIQDKLLQKQHFQEHGVAVPQFMDTPDVAAVAAAAEKYGLPLCMKSRKGGYDGRGNAILKSLDEAQACLDSLGGPVYAEQMASFTKELAVNVAQSTTGEIAAHPCVETVQKDAQCATVIAPARISAEQCAAAQELASKAVACLPGCTGIVGVELFLLDDGSLLLNEVAPRPHNSAHYSIEACHTSQFEQHIRAVCGMPLGDPSMRVNCAVMINVLGGGAKQDATGDDLVAATMAPIELATKTKGAAIHWYGKAGGFKAKRKMGHITVCAETEEAVDALAQPILVAAGQD